MYCILNEEDNFIALDKRAPMPCLRQGDSPGLSDELLMEFPYLSSLPDFGFTHRLDNETLGLILVAKNINYYETIRKLFQKKMITKTYHARVRGSLKELSGVIDIPIAHSKKNPKKMLTVQAGYRIYRGEPRSAKSIWKVIKSNIDSTDLELETNSGVRHQIRVHLNSIGHPICGDPLYGNYGLECPSLMLISKTIQYRCPLLDKDIKLESKLCLNDIISLI
jgi:23S rRNA-/tRNA-specific pseudouridylate synthase